MIRRWHVLVGLIALMWGAVAPAVTAQDQLAGIPEGPLRDQAAWFVDVLNRGGDGVTEQEVAAHFSPGFLANVSAGEVLATAAQLHPVLGEVTVGRIARGTTETDAGFQLIGESGVVLRVTLWVAPDSGLIGGLLIEPDTSAPAATAVASPVASPQASPVAVAPPPAMTDVLPGFQAAHDEVLASGWEVVRLFLAGDDAGLRPLLSPELAGVFDDTPASMVVEQTQANRVHFELPEFGVVFDGHFAPEGITGFFYQAGPGSFQLTPEEPQTGDVPAGRWNGTIFVPGGGLDISVVFSGGVDDLAATLDIPDQGMMEQPLANVRFRAEEPIGDLLSERALPLGAATGNNTYTAAYAWAEGTLTVTVAFHAEGDVTSLLVAATWPLPPDPAAGASVTPYRLPFEGTWLVLWGGATELENYHAPSPNQRHAYDLVVWRDGATYRGDGTTNEQYHAWGQNVLAPADGTVVAAMNDQPDLRPNQITDPTSGPPDPSAQPAGNHVVIQTAEDEFVFVSHMQQGSVRVQKGDEVRAGEVLGLVGNSGNSSEPHIHIHVQDTEDPFAPDAVGLPVQFTDYLVNGEPSTLGAPVQGDLIAPQD
ncbi:MAG TPA: peptidoglycan DD-metalloendopeptidase family protein [Thermomicrobiales bacterium]|nr:peptidoglycan DD-metalloendopeptidase family protein [Thermomicrobiales bacterium]